MAPHSSTLAWKIPWMEEPGRLQSMGSLESDTTERLHFHFSLSCIGGGNGNPLQCSCLENPRDGGAWWAAVYGVAQSRTRLKRLSNSSSHHLVRASCLPLDMGYPFFGGIQHSPVDCCCFEVSCNFGVLAGEDDHTSFYSAIIPLIIYYKMLSVVACAIQ